MPTAAPNYYQRVMTGLLGQPSSYGGILDPAAQEQAQREAQMSFASRLMQAGGYSDRPTTFGQAVGGAMAAGQQTQQSSLDAALQAQLVKSQIVRNEREQTPDQVRQFQFATQNGYKGTFEEWKKITQQEAALPAAIQEYNLYSQQATAAGKTPEPFESWIARRAQMGVGAQYIPTKQGGQSGGFSRVTGDFTPQTTVEQEASAAGEIAGGETGGKASETRRQSQIDSGLDAADALATVRRGQQLLGTIKTGGIDSAKLAITQAFGITGADEAELSANLGKAVLSQLRATFGAQFTEKEGSRLAEIEAGFGKSTEGNKRLLDQAEKILDRAARRGLRAAQDSGDSFSADEITKSMGFSLDPAAPKPSHATAAPGASPPKKETAAQRAKRLGI